MDLQKFRRKAVRNKASLTAFLQKLDEVVPEDMPKLVAEADAAVWKDVNCLSCANCCKTMTPTWRKADVVRASAHLGMTPKEFVEKWLYKEEETGDWVNVNVPCQFLDLNTNMCSIYEVRPKDCAEFPHHNKKPFDDYNDTFIGNVVRCPATYELVSRLKKKIERDYEW
ncbi:YkgJ family cysteine cluster protein [Chitinophagaceae bacterium MMS25-I14]